MNKDEILELITAHTISIRIEEGNDLIHEIYVNDFVDDLLEAINYNQSCKSDNNSCACGCGRKTKYKFSGLESCKEDYYSK